MTTIISNNKLSKLFICRKFVTTNSFESDNNRAQKKMPIKGEVSAQKKYIIGMQEIALLSGKINNETQKYIFLRE